ncbi:MAG: hypothetical protein LUH63_05980 [Parabacteroides sp.]|nr:hypothetical protein [Parabacteroides sp.]
MVILTGGCCSLSGRDDDLCPDHIAVCVKTEQSLFLPVLFPFTALPVVSGDRKRVCISIVFLI